MPALRQVKSMVPAGWGGVGSVDFGSAAPLGQADILAVVRRSVNSIANSSQNDGKDLYDIPAFLRLKQPIVDFRNEKHWAKTPEYTPD